MSRLSRLRALRHEQFSPRVYTISIDFDTDLCADYMPDRRYVAESLARQVEAYIMQGHFIRDADKAEHEIFQRSHPARVTDRWTP